MGFLLLVIAGIAAVGVFGWYRYVRARKRREALFAFAAAHGLEYSRDDPFGLTDYPFRLFSLGDGRGCKNVLSGRWEGLPVTEADYWYYEESTDSKGGTSRSYHRFSVVIAELELDAPSVSIGPESLLTRLADHLGFHDIEFESDEFNRRFRVKATDREFAFRLVDARLMQWMLEAEQGEAYELIGNRLLVSCDPLQPAGLSWLFDRAMAFRQHVPRLVWTEYGTGPRAGEQEERSAP
ncbi:MAG TPA: hypothetical protein VF972_04580 [Actinomycetota bacterium]